MFNAVAGDANHKVAATVHVRATDIAAFENNLFLIRFLTAQHHKFSVKTVLPRYREI